MTPEQKTLLQQIILDNASAQEFFAVSNDYLWLCKFLNHENTQSILRGFNLKFLMTNHGASLDDGNHNYFTGTLFFQQIRTMR